MNHKNPKALQRSPSIRNRSTEAIRRPTDQSCWDIGKESLTLNQLRKELVRVCRARSIGDPVVLVFKKIHYQNVYLRGQVESLEAEVKELKSLKTQHECECLVGGGSSGPFLLPPSQHLLDSPRSFSLNKNRKCKRHCLSMQRSESEQITSLNEVKKNLQKDIAELVRTSDSLKAENSKLLQANTAPQQSINEFTNRERAKSSGTTVCTSNNESNTQEETGTGRHSKKTVTTPKHSYKSLQLDSTQALNSFDHPQGTEELSLAINESCGAIPLRRMETFERVSEEVAVLHELLAINEEEVRIRGEQINFLEKQCRVQEEQLAEFRLKFVQVQKILNSNVTKLDNFLVEKSA